ncbi:hypothetical protein, partial [Klebsiella michiganensis]|uniref:hypothetical protein n=1 Tax=Klebsiella michiganensis TaxID=1134687 RepID=UPI001CCBDC8C
FIAAQGVKQNGTIRPPNVGNRTIPPAGAIVAVCRLFNSLSSPVSCSTQSLGALRCLYLHNALNSR